MVESMSFSKWTIVQCALALAFGKKTGGNAHRRRHLYQRFGMAAQRTALRINSRW